MGLFLAAERYRRRDGQAGIALAARTKTDASRRQAATPAIIVHELSHAVAALAAAVALDVPAITLTSARGAAAYLGPTGFTQMIDAARKKHPAITVTAILDCGHMPGHALAALRAGVDHISVDEHAVTRPLPALRSLARRQGAHLVARQHASSLDLYNVHDADRACRDWLAKSQTGQAT